MKTILFLAMSFLVLSASAKIVTTDSFTVYVKADTEEQLLLQVEQTIPLIRSGEIQSAFQSNCLQNNNTSIKVTTVNIDKIYTVDSYDALTPSYTGAINYDHNNCLDSRDKHH